MPLLKRSCVTKAFLKVLEKHAVSSERLTILVMIGNNVSKWILSIQVGSESRSHDFDGENDINL